MFLQKMLYRGLTFIVNLRDKKTGFILIIFGFLLSPLCWWNDLFFNLPLAYGMGYLVSFINSKLFIPTGIITYWLSNILGIFLLQMGTRQTLARTEENTRISFTKDLWPGICSASLFTGVILLCVYLKILDVSQFLPNELLLHTQTP
ncbi:MAG: hypothetical protein ACK5CA_07160 [Cyanobacteriota bacterium]|jgi:hypothetical protein